MFLRSLRQPTTLAWPVISACLILLSAPAAHGQGGLVAPAGIEVTPMSLTLDASASVRRFGQLDAKPHRDKLGAPRTKDHAAGWTDIFFEDAEGAWPGPWDVFDGEPASGNDFWGDVSCRPFAANWSIWCADETNADCTSYDNDQQSWMIFGPFSLADAADARAEFAAWSEVEDGFDSLFVGASINGTSFFGGSISQDFDWSGFSLDLTSVSSLGDLTGQPAVWLAFVFTSDESFVEEGVYLDDILIEKLVDDGSCVPNATTLCLPGDNRFKVSVFFETTQGGGLMGDAQAIPLDSLGITQGGIFYFGNATNPEFLVKILDGCPVNNRWWVFFAATTNIGFDLTVTDTASPLVPGVNPRVYNNPDIHPATTITDTLAFATCP